MSKGSKRRPGIGFAKNYHGSSAVHRGSWVQDPVTGKLVQRAPRLIPEHHMIMKPLVPFVSPITRELITDRNQLRSHNKEHGVTNSADYSKEFLTKRSRARDDEMTGNNKQARSERVEVIRQVLDQYGVN